MTPGLANKLCIPVARKVCCNFPETLKSLPAEKSILTGSPIREELLHGNKEAARRLCGFHSEQAGSDDHRRLPWLCGHQSVRPRSASKASDDFQIVHICGKDNIAHPVY